MDDFDFIDVRCAIPQDLKKELDLGNNYLMGLVKDSYNNQCVKHLEIVENLGDVKKTMLRKGILIGIGSAVVTAVGTFAIKKLIDKKKSSIVIKNIEKGKTKEDLENKTFLMVDNYNRSIAEYITNINNGVLTLKNIKELIKYLSCILDQKRNEDITIDISDKELDALFNIIRKVSIKLAEEKNYSIDNNVLQIDNNKVDKILDYLDIQNDILEKIEK